MAYADGKLFDNAAHALLDFADDGDRERLSRVALRAIRNLADRWKLPNADAAALLGVSGSTWDRVKRGEDKTLNQDQLTRISALVGIYKGLHLLTQGALADTWPTIPNSGPLFDKRSPVATMIEGGIPRMLQVRSYIDAVRGGI